MKDKIMELLRFHSEGGTDKNHDYTGVIPQLYYEDIAKEIDSLYKAEQRDRYDRAIDWWNRNVIGTIKNTPKVIYGPNPKLIDRALRIASGIDKPKEE